MEYARWTQCCGRSWGEGALPDEDRHPRLSTSTWGPTSPVGNICLHSPHATVWPGAAQARILCGISPLTPRSVPPVHPALHLLFGQSSPTPLVPAASAEGAANWFEGILALGPEGIRKGVLSVVLILGVWFLRRLLIRLLAARVDDARVRYSWMKGTAWVAYVVVILLLGQIWLESVRNVGTFLGLMTAGLAIALKDVVTNLAGWVFILTRHPFSTGDRIEIGGHRGDVVDIRLFSFSLLEVGNWVDAEQSTGRIIHVPNGMIFTEPLANYTIEFPFIWHEIPVRVPFESDWRRVRTALGEILDTRLREVALDAAQAMRRRSHKFLISYRHFSPKVYLSVDDALVCLTLRFLVPVRQRRGIDETIWEAVLTMLEELEIPLAYPGQRLFVEQRDDRRGGRPPDAEP